MKPAYLPIAALITTLVRWWLQGSYNLYTSVEKRFYVPDPDLGWRVSSQHPVWVGIDVCVVIAAVTILVVIGSYLRRLRVIVWMLAAACLVVPVVAFASGSRAGRDELPVEQVEIHEIAMGLEAPAGRYEVVAHEGNAISARVSAGGETFDARFTGDIRGVWNGNPRALAEPMSAEISVAAESVDTGVRARSKHARTKYLQADTYPRIEVTIDRVLASHAAGADGVAFDARGTVTLIGRTRPIEISGTVKRADSAALARLGLTGTILLVKATFSISIKETALAAKAGDFGRDVIPISVSLVLRHADV